MDEFIARFDKLIENKGRHSYTDWRKPGSPWIPYLGGQSTSSLTAQERQQYLTAQDKGNCALVTDLERLGFLRLNPVLKPAFDREDVREVFADEIAWFDSHGSYRCRALKLYREGLLGLRQSGAKISPVNVPRLRRQGLNLWPPDPRVSWMSEHKRTRGLYYLTNLALCKEYRPAISDILRFLDTPRILILSDEEEFYIAARSRHLGFSVPVIGERIETLYHKLKPRIRVQIEFAAEGSKLSGELRRKVRCYPPR